MSLACNCPSCGNPLEYEANQQGFQAPCPICSQELILPVCRPTNSKSKIGGLWIIVLVAGLVAAFVVPAIVYALLSPNRKDLSDIAVGLFFTAAALGFYFLPSIVAKTRDHRNFNGISILNFFFGWTVIGWIGALIWAVHQDKEA